MEQSQFVEIIRTLTPVEKDVILQFASLPFINDGKMKTHVLPLLIICLNHSWNENGDILEKKNIHSALFPEQKYLDGKVEKIMVEAHKVIRTALIVSQYLREDNDFYQGFDFSEIVRVKGLSNRHLQILARLQKLQEKNTFKNIKYFHQQFILENAIHEAECYNNQKKGDLNVPTVLQALDLNYLTNRFAILSRFLLQQKFTKLEIPEFLKVQIESAFVNEYYLELSIVLQVNYEIFKLLSKEQPEIAEIQLLFKLLKSNENNLDQENLQEYFSYLRSLSILVLSADIERVEIEYTLHELYKDNLDRGYLHYEGKLHPSRYWAVASNAVRVKDFKWAIEFIETYKHDLIGENETQDLYRLNLANYLFAIGNFSECLDNIPANSSYVDYLLTGKRLEIKAYYELNSDLLPYKLEAFKVFLSRTSPKLLSESQKQIHVDFANLLTQITLSIPGDQKRADLVIKRIQEKKQAAEWRWLLEKAKALKEK